MTQEGSQQYDFELIESLVGFVNDSKYFDRVLIVSDNYAQQKINDAKTNLTNAQNNLMRANDEEKYRINRIINNYKQVIEYFNTRPVWIKNTKGYTDIYDNFKDESDTLNESIDLFTKEYLFFLLDNFNSNSVKIIDTTKAYLRLKAEIQNEHDQEILEEVVNEINLKDKAEIQNKIKINYLRYIRDGLVPPLYKEYENSDFYEPLIYQYRQGEEEVDEFAIVEEEPKVFSIDTARLDTVSTNAVVSNTTSLFQDNFICFEQKVGYCLTLKEKIPKDIDTKDEIWFAREAKGNEKTFAEYQRKGEQEIFLWVRSCRNFIVCFSMETFAHLRMLDQKYTVENEYESAIVEDIKKSMMRIDGMDDVGSEPWRFQIFEKQYLISLENDFERLRTVCRNTGVFRNDKFVSLKSILNNRREKILFANLVGAFYTGNKKTRDLKVHEQVQRQKELAAGGAIQSYYLS